MSEAIVESFEKDEKKSASTVLVEIALDGYRFGISGTGETFAIPKKGPKVVSMLRGSKTSLRAELARTYFSALRRAAPQQALADALMVVEGLAQEGDEEDLHLRVARHRDDVWLDLGDPSGRAIQITGGRWTTRDSVPVLFKRTTLMSPLPEPVAGGALDELWQWLNVTEADRPLVAAWLVSALYADIPHPILSFFGEQGTGKTTALKLIVSTIDPSPVPTRKPPRDADSWVTAAAGSWVVGLDNLSDVQPWLSDSLCRAVTGDGDVRRRLYTDQDHAVFAFRRCLCLNSIDLGAVRGDLAERMLPITLEPIPDARRKLEADVWPRWAEAHPRILGALLDLAAGVQKALPFVELASKPRMADFARILAAVDAVTGSRGLRHYLSKQSTMAVDSLSADPFVLAIQRIGGFEGTAAELLDRVTPEKPPKGWPSNARAVTQRLRRQAPVMRKAGWRVSDDDGANHDKVVRWSIHPEIARNHDPQYPHDPQNGPDCGYAGQAGNKYGTSQEDGPVREVVL